MPEHSIVTWNSMLAAYARVGHLDDAWTTFENMPQTDLFTWTTLLVACCESGNIEHAKKVYEKMPEGCVVAWNAMVSALAENGHLEDAARVFENMPEHSIVSWTAMVTAYSRNGLLEHATRVFDLMPHHNTMVLEPRPLSFLAVLIACNHTGKTFKGRSYFVSMAMDHGLRPSKQHYCCVVDLLGRAGHLDFAEELIASMPFEPNILEWTCLLGACRSYKDSCRESRVMQRVMELDPRMGGGEAASVLLSSIHFMAGRLKS
ncbi:hypothetical protein SELMODRAFT_131485 [Selaginella moellendorffii]|uniref:Pentacotripeptide-repeat region of PRORP domain-containing protein n=1 Tax=Selaginella moellendorffii TaxID=88036 RepID=D8T456_SELML|nr:hypothetical protein SELMODRAFT_131485 [Selaginella moellendorffii]